MNLVWGRGGLNVTVGSKPSLVLDIADETECRGTIFGKAAKQQHRQSYGMTHKDTTSATSSQCCRPSRAKESGRCSSRP